MSTKAFKKTAKIPRRAQILSALRKHDAPVTDKALFQVFSLKKGPGREQFLDRLQRMQQEGQVIVDRRGRYGLPEKIDAIRGRVIGHSRGFGFMTPESGGNDLFIPASEMRKVMHGDRVLARVARIDRRGRREATILEVLERAQLNIVGRFVVERGLAFVDPNDARLTQDVFIPPDNYLGARPGQIVVAEVMRQPGQRAQPVGRVIEVLGEHLAPGMEIEVSIRKHNLSNTWSGEVEEELRKLPSSVDEQMLADRWDIRELPLVTIDGEDARDYDDAVYCERDGGGWRLIVAIADVSHYVTPDSALDHAATERGNSVYFPDFVVPMLPEALSNDLCSLRPDVDRLCFVCEIWIDGGGEVGRFEFGQGIMRSSARLTYNEVFDAFSADGVEEDFRFPELLPALRDLFSLTRLMRARRALAGVVDFDLPESRIVFDEERKIQRIEAVQRNEAHRLIEECMLAANVCAARLLESKGSLGIYRVHERPDQAKLENLRRFLGEFGLSLGGGDRPAAGHYAEVVKQCANKPYARIVQTAMLRSMKQAVYSADCSGHFALGFEHYTHFTSPIRRYPDLVVHRELKNVLDNQSSHHDEIDKHHVSDVADHCSMTERRADEATREVIQWLKAEFMLDHVGDEFPGTVTSVTDFGLFVEIDEFMIEGLIHITALGQDYFRFDPIGHRLTGERSGKRFQVGDQLKVRVVRVDLDETKIDLEPVGDSTEGGRGGKPRKQKRRRSKRR